MPASVKPAETVLHDYCRDHHLTGHLSEHPAPFLPYRITVRTQLNSILTQAAGWTPELAATAILRNLDA